MPFEFWTFNKIDGYGLAFNIICSVRGIGKTYAWESKAIEHYQKTGMKSVILTRYVKDYEDINVDEFFDAVKNNYEEPITIKGKDVYLGKNKFARFISLNEVYRYKRSSLVSYDRIFSDECLAEDGRYLKDEYDRLMSLYDTMDRRRGVTKVYLFTNMVTITNPYFEGFQLYLPCNAKEGCYRSANPDKKAVLQFITTGRPEEDDFTSTIKGTKYGGFANNGTFFMDNVDAVERPNNPLQYLYSLVHEDDTFSVWHEPKTHKIYVALDERIYDVSRTYTVDKYAISDRYASRYVTSSIDVIQRALENALLRFRSVDCKNRFYEVLKLMR